MNVKSKVIITLAVLAVLTLVFFYASRYITEVTGKSILGWIINSEPEGTCNLDSFAKALTAKGAILYVKAGCPHCKAQEDDFGDAVKYLEIVDCAENAEECANKGITGVPTWELNGELLVGRQTLEKLAEFSGCELIK